MNTDYSPVNPIEQGQYNSLWSSTNPINNELAAKAFAVFTSKSDVPIEKLRIIWKLSVPKGSSIMTETQFYTALRYISLYQNSYVDLSSQLLTSTLNIQLNPPRFSFQETQQQQQVPVQVQQVQAPTHNYALTPTDHANYHKIFTSYDKDGDGYLTTDESVLLFKKSNLSDDQLSQIWSLADKDEDGQLTSKEFCKINVFIFIIHCFIRLLIYIKFHPIILMHKYIINDSI
jgi:epidermal growth factor receptor substrate 15